MITICYSSGGWKRSWPVSLPSAGNKTVTWSLEHTAELNKRASEAELRLKLLHEMNRAKLVGPAAIRESATDGRRDLSSHLTRPIRSGEWISLAQRVASLPSTEDTGDERSHTPRRVPSTGVLICLFP